MQEEHSPEVDIPSRNATQNNFYKNLEKAHRIGFGAPNQKSMKNLAHLRSINQLHSSQTRQKGIKTSIPTIKNISKIPRNSSQAKLTASTNLKDTGIPKPSLGGSKKLLGKTMSNFLPPMSGKKEHSRSGTANNGNIDILGDSDAKPRFEAI
jgi:hypothetical protein